MTISAKPSHSDRFMNQIVENNLRRNPLLLFVLASVLVHGIGLVIFALIERSQPTVQLVPETAPIDFVVVPPEELASKAETDPPPQEETRTNRLIEPEPPTPETVEPITPSPAVVVPEPIPESLPTPTLPPEEVAAETPPKPELPSQTVAVPEATAESPPTAIKPPKEIKPKTFPSPEPVATPLPSNILAENQNSSEILSGSDRVIEQTETKIPEITKLEKSPINANEPESKPIVTRLPQKITPSKPLATEPPAVPAPETENAPVATRLPPKITPTQPLETKPPATPPSTPNKPPATSRAASLLGGNLKRSFDDDGGDSFFKLDNNASQQASNPELNPQQRLDMRNYFSEIKRRVRRNWNPKYAVQEYTTVLSFSIQRNGQIALLKVRRTSGSQDVDREALEAVQNSGPFAPLPANFPADMLNLEFNFNIYIY